MKKNSLACFYVLLMALASLWVAGTAFAQGLAPARIDGMTYIDLGSFSREKGLRYSWDPVAQKALVSGENGQLSFRVGSTYVLNREKFFDLKGKVRFLKGVVLAPILSAQYLERILPVPAQFHASGAHRIRTIVIDAGHGGFDSGAMSPRGIPEKKVVLDIAMQVKELLEARGIQVVLTRNRDVFVPLSERVRIANRKDVNFFVSIHANAARTRSLKGLEVYHLSEATDDEALALERSENSELKFENTPLSVLSQDSRAILWDLKQSGNRRESIHIADDILGAASHSATVSSKRLRAANFFVLKRAECPSVLVEVGYLTNWQDEERIESASWREHLAQGIANGLIDYKKEFERTDGFTR